MEHFIGIDVSKATLDIATLPDGDIWTVTNDDQGLAELAPRLVALAPVVVVLEATGGFELLAAITLAKSGLPVAVVNPRQVRDFAKAMGRLAKTDALDAGILADFARRVRPEPRPLPDEAAQLLESLLTRRRQIVDMLTAEKNRLGFARGPVKRDISQHIRWLEGWFPPLASRHPTGYIRRIAPPGVPMRRLLLSLAAFGTLAGPVPAQRTAKPPLHGKHWMAITGKPLGATAGAMIFQKGGNAVDAACAMLAAVTTMWDVLSWGGETQALIYHPGLKKVIGINALGVAPTGATAAFFTSKGMRNPPEYGPLAALTPGTPGGLLTMLAEYGRLSLKEVLQPALQLADGYPIEAQTANSMENQKARIKQWKYSRAVYLPHLGEAREAPAAGEVFVQPDLAATLRKLIEAEDKALKAGKSRKEAIYAAYDRFYKGDIAEELVRGAQEEGGLITLADLANWRVKIEEPLSTNYRGIEVYKLPMWQQGPVLLQALNILENADVKAMGYNSTRYVHTLYQAMSLAFADRDFYYGDPAFPPDEPVKGLLSKEYAKQRYAQINWERNDPGVKPGDPYPFQGGTNPFKDLLDAWRVTGTATSRASAGEAIPPTDFTEAFSSLESVGDQFREAFNRGTTSIEAADEEGWVVSVTPSGGWIPAVIAGRTGVGLSQRMQSFVTDPADGPFNVVEPGKRPRVTLTPTLALKDGLPYLAFAVQGGDSQDQNLLQFFLNVVEFGMTPQQAVEAPNINSYQMRSSFGAHEARPGRMLLADAMPDWVRADLRRMGYTLEFSERTSGPINAILFDRMHGTMWGGSSHHGEDYGIAW